MKIASLFQFPVGCGSTHYAMSGDYTLGDTGASIDSAPNAGSKKIPSGTYSADDTLAAPGGIFTGITMAGTWSVGLASLSSNAAATASVTSWELHLE